MPSRFATLGKDLARAAYSCYQGWPVLSRGVVAAAPASRGQAEENPE